MKKVMRDDVRFTSCLHVQLAYREAGGQHKHVCGHLVLFYFIYKLRTQCWDMYIR